MLAIQEFISSFEDFDEAAKWLKIKVGIIMKKVSLYGRPLWFFSSPKGSEDLLSRESNGLILNTDGKVVCLPPLRPKLLHNIDDKRIDWSDVVVTEKEEGRQLIVYFCDESWHIATETSVQGEDVIKIDKGIKSTLKHEIITRFNRDFGAWQAVFDYPDNDNFCFVFNYNWKYNNSSISRPEKPSLILETIVDRVSFSEIEKSEIDDYALMFGFERPLTVSLKNNKDKEGIERLTGTFSTGVEILDGKSEKYFLINKLYNALYVTKIATVNILPIHVLNVARNCRNDKDFSALKREYAQLMPIVDMLLSAEVDLAVTLSSQLDMKSTAGSISKPGAILKMEKEIFDTIRKDITGTDFRSVRDAIASVRQDRIISYTTAVNGTRFIKEMEKLKEDNLWN